MVVCQAKSLATNASLRSIHVVRIGNIRGSSKPSCFRAENVILLTGVKMVSWSLKKKHKGLSKYWNGNCIFHVPVHSTLAVH